MASTLTQQWVPFAYTQWPVKLCKALVLFLTGKSLAQAWLTQSNNSHSLGPTFTGYVRVVVEFGRMIKVTFEITTKNTFFYGHKISVSLFWFRLYQLWGFYWTLLTALEDTESRCMDRGTLSHGCLLRNLVGRQVTSRRLAWWSLPTDPSSWRDIYPLK